jgi:amino acid permease
MKKALFCIAFATILMAFISHTTVLDVFAALESPTSIRKSTIIISTNTIVFFCYALIGVFGYLQFGEDTLGYL